MNQRAREAIRTGPLCLALLVLLAGCDGGKPPVPAASKPVVISPPKAAAVKSAPAAVAQPAAQPSAKQKADAELAARVKAALSAEPQIRGFAIDVTADDGKVALFGTVGTKQRRDTAGKIASQVAGVKSVLNNLAIVAGS